MMVGGAIAGLVALLFVILACIGLIVLAFFHKRLALLGLICLIAYLFYPVVAFHVSYALHARGTPFDHIRHLKNGSFGVILPDDGSLTRLSRHWSDDPAGSLNLVSHLPQTDEQVSFRIYRVSDEAADQQGLPAATLFDMADCPTPETEFGLLYIAPSTCPPRVAGDYRTYGSGHVFITPAASDIPVILYNAPYREPDEIGGHHAQLGPFRVAISSIDQPIANWRAVVDHVAQQIDETVVLIERP